MAIGDASIDPPLLPDGDVGREGRVRDARRVAPALGLPHPRPFGLRHEHQHTALLAGPVNYLAPSAAWAMLEERIVRD